MKLKFTPKAEEMLAAAQRVAINLQHEEVQPLHLLSALYNSQDPFCEALFQQIGFQRHNMDEVLKEFMGRLEPVVGMTQDPKYSQDFFDMLNRVQAAAEGEKADAMKVHHLFIGLHNSHDDTVSIIMKTFDITPEAVNGFYSGNKEGYTEETEEETPQVQENYLAQFGTNLVELAAQNKLDPVIGRDEEMRQLNQVLSRRTKNNPVLVGEPGVGKTAITEGFAQRIAAGDIPNHLKGCVLYSINIGDVVAGAEYRGEFEKRLKGIIKEVEQSDGGIILVIDEIHTILKSEEGQNSAADILKPALARNGGLSIIGTTTLDEYQKYFEKDATLERRFQRVLVEEPTDEDCITILRGLKERYENYHEVQIKDEALVTAVRMAKRYLTARAMPDSAIDLIDEACSKIRTEINSKPVVIDKLERELMNVQVAITNIDPEEDGVQDLLDELKSKKTILSEQVEHLNIQWSAERKLIDEIQALKRRHEKMVEQKTNAERDKDTDTVAELTSAIGVNENETEKLRDKLLAQQADNKLIREVVTSLEIAEVVSDKTGIPTSKMQQSENEKLLQIEAILAKNVIGQDPAISEIAEAIRINRVAGMGDANKPIGSFIFLGTTGVGKTHLAKELAKFLFNDENAMVRVDMSEFSEKHAISRLIGAPPGYVGYDEGGELTEPVRNRPYCILLLDEIEKAHPDIFNILLQVLEEGHVTDSQGRKVNFKNAIIIMTSNVGSDVLQEAFDEAEDSDSDQTPQQIVESVQEDVDAEVKQKFKPEILNRVDEIIMFNPLDEVAIRKIAALEIKKLAKSMKKGGGYELSWTEEVLDFLAEVGYDPAYGARPVKRAITDHIRGPLSKELLKGTVSQEAPIEIGVEAEGLVFYMKPIHEEIPEHSS